MSAAERAAPPVAASTGLGRLHGLLAVQSVVVVLVSINRLSTLTTGYVLPNEFLRWVDFLNMLVLPLASLVAFYLLKKELEAAGSPALGRGRHLALSLTFIVGAYLLGASYGDHEVTNYLHARFCPDGDPSALCRIVVFNDDEFSHWVFFTGFVLVNAALLLLQALFPHRVPVSGRDIGGLALNGVFIGAGIFANLAFEVIGLDLYIVALLAGLALYLFWRAARRAPPAGAQPLAVYYSVAYSLGLVGTFVYKLLAG